MVAVAQDTPCFGACARTPPLPVGEGVAGSLLHHYMLCSLWVWFVPSPQRSGYVMLRYGFSVT